MTEPPAPPEEPRPSSAPGTGSSKGSPVGPIVGGVVGGVVGLLLFLGAAWWWWRRKSGTDDASLVDDTKSAFEPEPANSRDAKVPLNSADARSGSGVFLADNPSDQATSVMPASGSVAYSTTDPHGPKVPPLNSQSKLRSNALEHKAAILQHIGPPQLGNSALSHKAAFLPQDETGPSHQRSLPRPPLVQYEQDAKDVAPEPLIFPPRYKEAWGARSGRQNERTSDSRGAEDAASVLRADDGGSVTQPR